MDISWRKPNQAALLLSLCIFGVSLGFGWLASRPVRFARGSVDIERINSTTVLIDPNSASMGELMLLPEIGPGFARRIVEYRLSIGFTPFLSAKDLEQIPGIGPGRSGKISRYLIFPAPDEIKTGSEKK